MLSRDCHVIQRGSVNNEQGVANRIDVTKHVTIFLAVLLIFYFL